MNREEMNNVAEEIKDQDLESQEVNGGINLLPTWVQLSVSRKCGKVITMSYECTSNNKKCK